MMASLALETKPMLQKPPGYGGPTTQPLNTKLLPPRKSVLPPSFRPEPYQRQCCCTCCILVVVVVFTAMISAALIYFFYDPSLPKFHLGSFCVPQLNVTEKADNAYLDADTAARVEVKNRNGKMVWHFDETVEVSEENVHLNLVSTKVAGFSVKEKVVPALKVETSVRDKALDDRQRRKVKSLYQSKAW